MAVGGQANSLRNVKPDRRSTDDMASRFRHMLSLASILDYSSCLGLPEEQHVATNTFQICNRLNNEPCYYVRISALQIC